MPQPLLGVLQSPTTAQPVVRRRDSGGSVASNPVQRSQSSPSSQSTVLDSETAAAYASHSGGVASFSSGRGTPGSGSKSKANPNKRPRSVVRDEDAQYDSDTVIDPGQSKKAKVRDAELAETGNQLISSKKRAKSNKGIHYY